MTTTLPAVPADPIAPVAAAEIAAVLKVLADPTRLSIYLLLREGEMCVCELAGMLRLAENLISHHLGVLRRAGLVHDRRDASDARWVYYQLDAAALGRLFARLGALFDPRTLGTRMPTCGPAALIVPQRAVPR
ncbi:MAG TPA: metalloregulator ArsR/SmtB family transcription factor [Ktedonobacterales bacterium]|nr:metalloregulator ArsR/SmtB family transcription factor [Ktedonobacterales bacterium]